MLGHTDKLGQEMKENMGAMRCIFWWVYSLIVVCSLQLLAEDTAAWLLAGGVTETSDTPPINSQSAAFLLGQGSSFFWGVEKALVPSAVKAWSCGQSNLMS